MSAENQHLLGPERRAVALLVLLMVTALAPFVWTSVTSPDEFTCLGHALRIARGEVLYRDFFDLIVPLSRWLAALTLWVAGPSLLAARALQAVLLTVAGWQLYWLARRLQTPVAIALLPGPLMALTLYPLLPIFSHHWVVLPFELGALQCGLVGLAGQAWRPWIGAGVLAGLGILALQSDGVVVTVALALAVVLAPWLTRTSWRAAPRGLTALGAGMALPLLAAAAWLALQGALGAAIDDVWRWPLAHYRSAGGVNDIKPFTDLAVMTSVTVNWVNLPFWYMRTFYSLYLLALAPLALLVSVAWGLDLAGRRASQDRLLTPLELAHLPVILLAAGDFVLATRGRADSIHLGLYAVPALLLAVVLAGQVARRSTGPGLGLVRWLPVLSLLAFGLAGAGQTCQAMRADPASWVAATSPDQRLAASPAIAYLRSHGRPGDRLIGFPFGEFFGFYGWPSASSYNEMLPPEDGYHTAEEYQAFWAELLARRPRFVVFQPFLPEAFVHKSYFRSPLTGYRLKVALPSPLNQATLPAYIYERE